MTAASDTRRACVCACILRIFSINFEYARRATKAETTRRCCSVKPAVQPLIQHTHTHRRATRARRPLDMCYTRSADSSLVGRWIRRNLILEFAGLRNNRIIDKLACLISPCARCVTFGDTTANDAPVRAQNETKPKCCLDVRYDGTMHAHSSKGTCHHHHECTTFVSYYTRAYISDTGLATVAVAVAGRNIEPSAVWMHAVFRVFVCPVCPGARPPEISDSNRNTCAHVGHDGHTHTRCIFGAREGRALACAACAPHQPSAARFAR